MIWQLGYPNTNRRLTVATFSTNFDMAGSTSYFELDSTKIMGRLIYGNSSHYVTTLKFSAARSLDITCNIEMLSYRYSKGKPSVGKQSSSKIPITETVRVDVILLLKCVFFQRKADTNLIRPPMYNFNVAHGF